MTGKRLVARDLCAPPAFGHFRRLTTDLGIWQHARGREPDPAHGYSIDDIARALIVVNHAASLFPVLRSSDGSDKRSLEDLAGVFLTFLETAQIADGRFHNFVAADGRPLDEAGSDDSFGRTVWALGDTIAHAPTPDHRARAQAFLHAARDHVRVWPYARTNAFLLLGLAEIIGEGEEGGWEAIATQLAADLVTRFQKHQDPSWKWFEDGLRYSNGALPLALFRISAVLPDRDPDEAAETVAVAQESLDFLLKTAVKDGTPAPIGNRGWYDRGGQQALYDQQPVDAAAMVLACLEAWKATEDDRYKTAADGWLRWYEGNNLQRAVLLEEDGAVHDGLNANGVNPNCGAESGITYVLARLRWAEVCCGG
jgi:hypothetical protein